MSFYVDLGDDEEEEGNFGFVDNNDEEDMPLTGRSRRPGLSTPRPITLSI